MMESTDPQAAAANVTKFDLMWNGERWHAVETEDEIFLSRICTGCWATGPGYAGMWSTNRHTVELVITRGLIAERDARVERLRAVGETEAADELAGKAAVFL